MRFIITQLAMCGAKPRFWQRALWMTGLCSAVGVSDVAPVLAQNGYSVKQDVPMSNGARNAQQEEPIVRASSARVTFAVKDSSVMYVVRTLAKQGGMLLSVDADNPLFTKRIDVRVANMPVMDAITQALRETGLVATLLPDGVTIAIRSGKGVKASRRQQAVGGITGRVVDSASGKAVSGVTVQVQGLKRSMVTDEKGMFSFAGIPVGEYVVSAKLFGYRAASRPVVVVEGKSVSVEIRMAATATELSGVVTTATGTQRRIEVGNDITTINVDSVMKVMPVSTFTDLLATRVPGLTVMATSGAPGAPSRIRIRGVNSINMSNDPVVIVDGVRVNSAQTENSGNLVGSLLYGMDQLVSSPLDAIDPSSIETVEVFKGPSAVALYGTDAVNGVIVVTTKRGQSGPMRWVVDGIWGQTTMPGTWPTNYMRLGTDQFGFATECPSVQQGDIRYQCTGIDGALLQYQLLNDPTTTVFGTGQKQTYRTTVSGGTRGFSYSISGSLNTELGILKMPDADVRVLQDAGEAIPRWQRRPQGSEAQSGTVKISADLGDADAEFTTTLTRTSSRTTPLQGAITAASHMAPGGVDLSAFGFSSNPWSALGSGVLRDIPNFRAKTSTQSLLTRNSLRILAKPLQWIQTEATAGLEVSMRKDLNVFARGNCSIAFGGNCTIDQGGQYNTGSLSGMITSLILRASAPTLPLARWISLRPSVAGDYTRTKQSSIRRTASGLPAGATSGNGAARQQMSEFSDNRSTVGVYGEVMLGVADQLYLPLSLRLDAGSGLGSKVRPTYPRINPSFLVSDMPAFRQIPLIGRLETVRLRTAYGQSGVQPSVAEKMRTYRQVARVIDGIPVLSTEISSLGNALLRPERTSEIEGGADIETFDGRLTLSLTGYRKRTLDALIGIRAPQSVNGGMSQLRNVGTVLNTGLEMSMNTTVLQQHSAVWQMSVGLSKNRNTLVKLGRDSLLTVNPNGISTRFVEGYPIFGQWALPIIGFADLNGDGWITTKRIDGSGVDEVQVGTDPIYLGAPYPVFESSLHSTFTLFRNISIGMAFNYQHGLVQTNANIANLHHRAFNDSTTPFVTQAYMAVAQPCRVRFSGICSNNVGVVQTTSTLRFNGLSVGYMLPHRLTAAISRSRAIRVAIQGTNLGLWTNYSGKDPNVNSSMSEVMQDNGVLPTPRVWQFTVGIN